MGKQSLCYRTTNKRIKLKQITYKLHFCQENAFLKFIYQ